jgi:oligosaccharide translocation protein RFT1
MADSLEEISGERSKSAKRQVGKAASSKDGDMAKAGEKLPASSSEADQSSIPSTSQPTSSGTLYLILIQVMSRGLTFVGNQVLLRFLSPELLGLSVQLELFSVFVLYFSRESLRVALQRLPPAINSDDRKGGLAAKSKSEESQAIVNSSYIAIVIGLPLALVTAYLYQHNASQAVILSPGFNFALQVYVLATIIELLGEPSFAVLQQRLLYGARARSETLAAISKCVSACAAAFFFYSHGHSPSVLPAAIGQLCYALVVSIDYARTAFPIARANEFSMAIKSIKHAPEYAWARFSKSLTSLAATLYGQSIFKQILTQGDAYILSFSTSLSDQGAFALASNYGGLIARLFFQPIEEDSRNAFGRLLAGATTGRRSSPDVSKALERLVGICHLYGIVAIGSCCFLDQALPVMVRLIIGRTWWTPEISHVLTTYCYYIPFMGFNGILDAFVTSVATPAQLATQSIWMVVFTAIYAASAYGFLQVLGRGAEGLVLANIINMTLRIGWSMVFINKLTGAYKGQLLGSFRNHRDGTFTWAEALPSAASIACGAGIAYGLRTAMARASGVTQTLQVLVMAGSLLGAAILVCELKFITTSASNILPPRAAGMVRTFEIRTRQRFSVRTICRTLVPEKETSSATSTQSD